MSATEAERHPDTGVDLDAWVAEQLAAFAPLGPADLVALAAILGYESVSPTAEAA
jgi:hypothetical protein